MNKEVCRAIENAKTADRTHADVQNRQNVTTYWSAAARIAALFIVLYALSLGPFLFSQSKKTVRPSTTPGAPKSSDAKASSAPAVTLEELKSLQAVLETSMGDIVIQFYTDKAPKHALYIAGLVKAGKVT